MKTLIRAFAATMLFFVLHKHGVRDASAVEPEFAVVVTAREANVEVLVDNLGEEALTHLSVEIEFRNDKFQQSIDGLVRAGAKRAVYFTVPFPEKSGSYPLLTRVSYEFQGHRFSKVDAGYFNFRETARLDINCPIHDPILKKELSLDLQQTEGVTSKLFAPAEVLSSENVTPLGTASYVLTNQHIPSNHIFRMFSVHEKTLIDGRHETKLCPIEMRSFMNFQGLLGLPPSAYLIIGFAALVFAYIRFVRAGESPELAEVAVIRSAFSAGIIAIIAYLHLIAHIVPDHFLQDVPLPAGEENKILFFFFNAGRSLLHWLYFSGNNYENFSRYLLDPLLIYLLFFNGYVVRRYIRPNPETDKYWHLMLSLFSLIPFQGRDFHARRYGSGIYWSSLSKVAALSLLVKTFYLPVFASWTLRNAYQIYTLGAALEMNFMSINSYLVHLIVSLDVIIFCFAYLVELPSLKNQIKSVEPTLLGWIVCLICYPPFNQFAIVQTDIPLTAIFSASPYDSFQSGFASSLHSIQKTVLVLITLLWIIYVWASVALAAKASNLTNRGIIESGPYRYVRHPAYVAKILVWILTALFLGTMNIIYALVLGLVYGLRAWTEERHLSRDPEYLKYKEKVRWWYIPGLY